MINTRHLRRVPIAAPFEKGVNPAKFQTETLPYEEAAFRLLAEILHALLRRAELQSILADVESGKLRVGDSATTKEYKQQLRKSIELLDQIIKQLEARQ